MAVATDEKRGVWENLFLGEFLKKLDCWIGASPSEESDAE
jgi:hypothetical protein